MPESLSIPAVLKSDAGQALLFGLQPLDRFPGRMAVARAVCEGLGLVDAQWTSAAIELHGGAGGAGGA